MKQIINLLISGMTLFGSVAYADSGAFFRVITSGSPASANIVLCLNGKQLLSCQRYHINAQHLSISTTINHSYPSAGIKILTPNYRTTPCVLDPKTNYCLFAANEQTPTAVTVQDNTPAPHTVSGTVSGLVGSLSLQNNNGDTLTRNTDGSFTFPTTIAQGSTYHVTVSSQPATQTCTVNNSSGTIGSSDITNVQVTCSTHTYTVGGAITGLVGSLSLQNNGGDTVSTSSNGSFTFSTPIAQGSNYLVTVSSQPLNQTCTVSNGSGTMSSGNVANVQVTCSTPTYTLGGTITNLVGSVVLQNNGGDSLPLNANGGFTFATPVAQGSNYLVTVSSQPPTQTCTVSNDSGTMAGSNITNVLVNCVNNTTTLSVSATGTIPVNNSFGSITVTNTGASTAYNVSVSLPSGWTGVTQNASNCTSIAPNNGTCTLQFSTTAPYVAQGNIQVIGDNIANTPTTTLGFTVQGYLVWEVTNGTTVQVIDSSDTPPGGAWWDGFNVSIPGALSLTDGPSNTSAGVSAIGSGSVPGTPYATGTCYNSTNGGASVGSWYLPAICQLGVGNAFGASAGCSAGIANIQTNLAKLGLGGMSGNYWSSTIDSTTPTKKGWTQDFGNSGQVTNNRLINFNVRCARSLNY